MKKGPLSVLAWAALSLAVGALLLLACFLVLYGSAGSTRTEKIELPGNSFTAAIGRGKIAGNDFVISGFQRDGDRTHALLTTRRAFDASEYRYVAIDFKQISADIEASLFWIPAGREGFFRLPVSFSTAGKVVLDMGQHTDWSGQLSEIGVVLIAGPGPQPVVFGGVLLEPPGAFAAADFLLNDWTRIKGFSHSSINTLPATFSSGVLSPVLVAGAWLLVSLLLLMVARRFVPIPGSSMLLVLLVPWILLDLLWQRELSAEVSRVETLFAGKSMVERHLVAGDRLQYQYAMELKHAALPPTPARLFLLHDSRGHNFDRLKLQYYLLPHNIYNFGSLPPKNDVRPGDYVLVLGEVPGLEVEPTADVLRWQGGYELSVAIEHSHPLGKLYIVVDDAPRSVGGSAGA